MILTTLYLLSQLKSVQNSSSFITSSILCAKKKKNFREVLFQKTKELATDFQIIEKNFSSHPCFLCCVRQDSIFLSPAMLLLLVFLTFTLLLNGAIWVSVLEFMGIRLAVSTRSSKYAKAQPFMAILQSADTIHQVSKKSLNLYLPSYVEISSLFYYFTSDIATDLYYICPLFSHFPLWSFFATPISLHRTWFCTFIQECLLTLQILVETPLFTLMSILSVTSFLVHLRLILTLARISFSYQLQIRMLNPIGCSVFVFSAFYQASFLFLHSEVDLEG